MCPTCVTLAHATALSSSYVPLISPFQAPFVRLPWRLSDTPYILKHTSYFCVPYILKHTSYFCVPFILTHTSYFCVPFILTHTSYFCAAT